MRRDQLNRRTHRTSLAAKAERHKSPQMIQTDRAVRHARGGVIYGTVTRSLQYADPAGSPVEGYDAYLMTINGEEDVSVGKAVAMESEGYASLDVRDTNRWYLVGDEVPLVSRSGEWMILANLAPVGDETECSLRWNEDESRIMAVYK